MTREPVPPEIVEVLKSLDKNKAYTAEEVALKIFDRDDPDFPTLVACLEDLMRGVPPDEYRKPK